MSTPPMKAHSGDPQGRRLGIVGGHVGDVLESAQDSDAVALHVDAGRDDDLDAAHMAKTCSSVTPRAEHGLPEIELGPAHEGEGEVLPRR